MRQASRRNSSVQHLTLPPALSSLREVDPDRVEPALTQLRGQLRGVLRKNHVVPVRRRVQPEHLGVGGGGEEGVGEQPLQHGPAAGGEGRRVVGDRLLVEHGQGGVQVVVVGIDQGQPDHRASEVLLCLVVRAGVAAEAGARQQPVARQEIVALSLVDEGGRTQLRKAVVAQPVVVGGAFGDAFGVAEPGHEGPSVDDRGAVGREDHVGKGGDGVDRVDGVPEAQVDLAQPLPLGDGQRSVDGLRRVHPRVDGVDHVEVGGPAHEVVPGTCGTHMG